MTVQEKCVQTENQEIPFKHEKRLYAVRVVQKTSTGFLERLQVSILGDIQSLTEYRPEQPSVANPALIRGCGLDDIQKFLITTLIW